MGLSEQIKSYKDIKSELDKVDRIIDEAIRFSPAELELIINKLFKTLGLETRFDIVLSRGSEQEYHDILICEMKNRRREKEYKLIYENVNPRHFSEDDVKITFRWLFLDTDYFTSEMVSGQYFAERPYIRDFIRYVVDYRLEHQQEEINYDVVASEFVQQYRSKQKVFTPVKPKD